MSALDRLATFKQVNDTRIIQRSLTGQQQSFTQIKNGSRRSHIWFSFIQLWFLTSSKTNSGQTKYHKCKNWGFWYWWSISNRVFGDRPRFFYSSA